jgi:hypothetical protein
VTPREVTSTTGRIYTGSTLAYQLFDAETGEPMRQPGYRAVTGERHGDRLVIGDPQRDVRLFEYRIAADPTPESEHQWRGYTAAIGDKQWHAPWKTKKYSDKPQEWWDGYNQGHRDKKDPNASYEPNGRKPAVHAVDRTYPSPRALCGSAGQELASGSQVTCQRCRSRLGLAPIDHDERARIADYKTQSIDERVAAMVEAYRTGGPQQAQRVFNEMVLVCKAWEARAIREAFQKEIEMHKNGERLTSDIVVRGRMPTKQEYDASLRILRRIADAKTSWGLTAASAFEVDDDVEREAWYAINQAGLVRERQTGWSTSYALTRLGEVYLEQRSNQLTPNAADFEYRGMRIEKLDNPVQFDSKFRQGHKGHRKIGTQYVIHLGEAGSGGTKVVSTQRAAKEYIDDYLGPEHTPNGHQLADASEVSQLPIGSIVWLWKDGRVNDSPLVVISGERLTQLALLPERADGWEPGGDVPSLWGNEFVVVREGKGRLPTHGTAQRAAVDWMRSAGNHTPNASGHYVWVLDSSGTPMAEGPYGPYDLTTAKQHARIGAERGSHDRAVSLGADPKSKTFEIKRRYRRGTGEQML